MKKYIDILFISIFSIYFRTLSKFRQKNRAILVIQIVALGDILCSSSFYRNLRKATSVPIYVVCRKKYYDMYNKLNPYVKEFILFDDSTLRGKYKFFKMLHEYNVSITFDLTGSYFSKWVGYSTNSRFFGIDLRKSNFNYLYTNFINNDTNTHIVDLYFELLKLAGYRTNDRSLEFWGNKPFANNIFKDNIPTISIAMGAQNPKRRWKFDGFLDIIEYLTINGYKVVLVGSHDEVRTADNLRLLTSNFDNVYNLCGLTTIEEVGYIISQSKMLIGNDSGLIHIGACFNTPTIALFGPGYYKQWHPYSSNYDVVRIDNCEPCGGNPKCEDIKCLTELNSNSVINIIKKRLEKL